MAEYHFDTLAIHGGYAPEATTKSRALPIYQTTSYQLMMLIMPRACLRSRSSATSTRG